MTDRQPEQLAHVKTLPQMIRLTVGDIVRCEADPALQIQMNEWWVYVPPEMHPKNDPKMIQIYSPAVCMVCAAGAVAVQTLDMPKVGRPDNDLWWEPRTQHPDDERKLMAMNQIRQGNILQAWRYCRDERHADLPPSDGAGVVELQHRLKNSFYTYGQDPLKFKVWMLDVADALDKIE